MNRKLERFFLSKSQSNRFILGAQLCAVAVFLMSLISLFGWIFDHPILRSYSPGWIEMSLPSTIGFLTASASLYFLTHVKFRKHIRFMAAGFALFTLVLGVIAFIKFFQTTSVPKSMAFTSALNYILCGLALLLINVELKKDHRPSQYLALLLPIAPLQAIIVYAYGIENLTTHQEFFRFAQMPLHGAISWLLLSFGILMAKPDRGLLRPFTLDREFSQIWRFTLLMAALVPTLFGLLFSAGAQRQWIEPAFGYSFLSIACIIIMTIFIWRSALNTWHSRIKRLEAEDANKRALKLRDEFLSIASHELKTPLTSLSLQAQIYKFNLLREAPGTLKHDQLLEYFDRVDAQVGRLAQLVEDMLDISRIDAGRFVPLFEKTDLCLIVRSAIETLSPQLRISGCEIRLDLPHEVVGYWDRFRIEQVVINLITNAIKYGAQKPIHLSVTLDNNRALLKVRDHGIGIAKENQQRIFNRFERAVSAKGVTGLGLGLYIVKKVLDMHQGLIQVESKLHQGSTFKIELPLLPITHFTETSAKDTEYEFA